MRFRTPGLGPLGWGVVIISASFIIAGAFITVSLEDELAALGVLMIIGGVGILVVGMVLGPGGSGLRRH